MRVPFLLYYGREGQEERGATTKSFLRLGGPCAGQLAPAVARAGPTNTKHRTPNTLPLSDLDPHLQLKQQQQPQPQQQPRGWPWLDPQFHMLEPSIVFSC